MIRRSPRSRRSVLIPRKPGTPPGTLIIDPNAAQPVIRVLAYNAHDYYEAEVNDPEELKSLMKRWDVNWINVDGLGDADILVRLADLFDVHRLALEDVVHVDQRAKVEEYDTNLFIVARMVTLMTLLETEQVSMFIGKKYVLTFQERHGDCFDGVRERIRAGRKRVRSSGPDYLAYALLDALIDSYFPVVEKMGEQLETLETEVLDKPEQQTVARIQDCKSTLLALRRSIWPHREALRTILREELSFITRETTMFLRDCHDHAAQIIDLVENYRETCSDLMNVYLSTVSNRMNEVMKVLTVIATIFIPLSFIAGVYGMNFNPERSPLNMPELNWSWGYPFALGLMLAVAVAFLVYFHRRRWL